MVLMVENALKDLKKLVNINEKNKNHIIAILTILYYNAQKDQAYNDFQDVIEGMYRR